MANEPDLDGPRRRIPWRKVAIILGSLGVLLVVLYFVVSSTFFLRSVVLPRVAEALNAEITVADASFSPFSRIALQKLVVRTTGDEPLVTADEVRVRYDLLSILGGNIEISELTLQSPDIRIVQGPQGESNLDPVLEGPAQPQPESAEPLRLAIRNVTLSNGRLLLTQTAASGAVVTTELRNMEATVDRLENGQAGKLAVGSALRMAKNAPPRADGTNGVAEAAMSGAFDFVLSPDLFPREMTGNARLNVTRAEGGFSEFSGLEGVLEANMTPTEIRQIVLRFERGGQRLGQVLVSGPFDLTKAEARLKLEVQSIDRQVLNLIGAASAWDFGSSVVNATSVVDLSRDWQFIAATGKLTGRQLNIRADGQSTPQIDLDVEFQAQVNLADETALIQKLTLLGRREQKELLTASLDRPMNITWAPRERGFTESTFQLAVNQLDLRDWRAVLPATVPSGFVDARMKVLAQKDAKALTASLNASFRDLTAQIDTNRVEISSATFEAEGQVEDFRIIECRTFRFQAQQAGQPLVQASGSGRYDLRTQEAAAQIAAETALPGLLKQSPVQEASASNGLIRFSTAYTRSQVKQSAAGSLALSDFTGTYGDYRFQNFHAALDYSVDLSENILQLYRSTLKLQQSFQSGGTLDATGKINLTNQAAEVTFKIIELNEHALRPLLGPALGENQLVSISVNGAGSAAYNPNAESLLKGDFRVANWVVQDPEQTLPKTPLSLRLELDGAVGEQLLTLRQGVLSLTPTERANNQVQLQAKLDLRATNAAPSQLSLAAEALDLTPYYNLFAGRTNAPAAAVPPPAETAQTEPEPVHLPFSSLTADAKIGRLYLREIAVSNLVLAAKTKGSQIVIEPLQMSLNGAPVRGNASLNLGVPGYVYDIAFQASGVPVEPISNSFSDDGSGYLKGDLLAAAKISGAGITGRSLQKSLNGHIDLTLTNMNLEIVSGKTRRLLEPIALVLGVQELLRSPIEWTDVKATMGQGRITLNKFGALSPAFYAEAQGVIPIADQLTNSPLEMPVIFALRRSLAEKANLVPSDAPTNTAYVTLPQFAKLNGTLGNPTTQVDKLVIAGFLARSATRFVPRTSDKVGSILEGVGNILTGDPGRQQQNGAATNAPPDRTRQIIQGIGELLGVGRRSQSDTNGTPANAPPPADNPRPTP